MNYKSFTSYYQKSFEKTKSFYKKIYEDVKKMAKSMLESNLGSYSKGTLIDPSVAYLEKSPKHLNINNYGLK